MDKEVLITRNLLLYNVRPLHFIFSRCADLLGFGERLCVLASFELFPSLLRKLSCCKNNQLNIHDNLNYYGTRSQRLQSIGIT
jgi:hypothetical protein